MQPPATKLTRDEIRRQLDQVLIRVGFPSQLMGDGPSWSSQLLEFDSIGQLEFALLLEEMFGIEVSPEDLEQLIRPDPPDCMFSVEGLQFYQGGFRLSFSETADYIAAKLGA